MWIDLLAGNSALLSSIVGTLCAPGEVPDSECRQQLEHFKQIQEP